MSRLDDLVQEAEDRRHALLESFDGLGREFRPTRIIECLAIAADPEHRLLKRAQAALGSHPLLFVAVICAAFMALHSMSRGSTEPKRRQRVRSLTRKEHSNGRQQR